MTRASRLDPHEPPFAADPRAVAVLERLWDNGHAGYLVGGSVRDALLGIPGHDWDVATDARPDRIIELFPTGHYENRFGTVEADDVEITTFRKDHSYGDHRRPDQVTFTDDVIADLSRRDFTANAIAWGRGARAKAGEPGFVDPTGGRGDLDARLLRAVGDAGARFDEDALRLLRAARIAAAVGLTIEPTTLAAMRDHADDVRWVSGERAGVEIRRMLAADPPSPAFRTLADTGILATLLPELAAQLGVPQDKVPGHDLWDHTLATLDAAATIAPEHEELKLAALLHDVGKPETFSAGHFIGHPEAGAARASDILERIRYPGRSAARIGRLIAEHMFRYEPAWTDAAVRRFLQRVGPDLVDDLLCLRQADNVGSGRPAVDAGLAELQARIAAQLAGATPLSVRDLAIDGNDLQRELGKAPGPWVGVLLDRLLESVLNDPARNTRATLLADAAAWTPTERER